MTRVLLGIKLTCQSHYFARSHLRPLGQQLRDTLLLLARSIHEKKIVYGLAHIALMCWFHVVVNRYVLVRRGHPASRRRVFGE